MKPSDFTPAEQQLAAELHSIGFAAARAAYIAEFPVGDACPSRIFDSLKPDQRVGWCAIARHVMATKGGAS